MPIFYVCKTMQIFKILGSILWSYKMILRTPKEVFKVICGGKKRKFMMILGYSPAFVRLFCDCRAGKEQF